MVLSRKSWVFCTLVLSYPYHTLHTLTCVLFFVCLVRERFTNCYFLPHDLISFGENDDDEVDNEETYGNSPEKMAYG